MKLLDGVNRRISLDQFIPNRKFAISRNVKMLRKKRELNQSPNTGKMLSLNSLNSFALNSFVMNSFVDLFSLATKSCASVFGRAERFL